MCRERVYENSSLSMSGFVQEVPSFLYLYITQCSTNLYAAAWSSAAYRVRFSAFLCLFPDVNQLTDTRYNASITRSRAHCLAAARRHRPPTNATRLLSASIFSRAQGRLVLRSIRLGAHVRFAAVHVAAQARGERPTGPDQPLLGAAARQSAALPLLHERSRP